MKTAKTLLTLAVGLALALASVANVLADDVCRDIAFTPKGATK
jgi:hypothetical protein